jgi:hypothetical protein
MRKATERESNYRRAGKYRTFRAKKRENTVASRRQSR